MSTIWYLINEAACGIYETDSWIKDVEITGRIKCNAATYAEIYHFI